MTASVAAKENTTQHIPVMLDEVISALKPRAGEIYIDGTFGAGGYTRAVLEAADCTVIAIDRDPDAIKRSVAFHEAYGERFQIVEGCFGDMTALVSALDIDKPQGVMLDIGVSSFQIDEAARGFSFQEDGPLDMRMSNSGESAADVVNSYEETELANIIYRYGEERKSRRIAAAIVRRRADEPFLRTRDLALLVESVLGRPPMKKGRKPVHPATRTFQALRIHVNDELGELKRGLEAAEDLLGPEGRLVVVSFHSLEDRVVKNFMAERSGHVPAASRHAPMQLGPGRASSFRLETRGVIKPSAEEEDRNPRARSAKLRVAIRTDAPSWQEGAHA